MKDNSEQLTIAHLQMLQSTIERMHTASMTTKQVCIAIVSAVLAVAATKSRFEICLLSVMPALAMWLMDAYFLSIERDFRFQQRTDALAIGMQGEIVKPFVVALPTGWKHRLLAVGRSMISFAIWPIYLIVISTVAIVCIALV